MGMSTTKMRFQTSLPQPTPINEKDSRHVTPPISSNNKYTDSRAERYVLSRAQMLTKPHKQDRTSFSTASSITGTNLPTSQIHMGHAERMDNWRQNKINEISKKQKYKYVYGRSLSSSSSSNITSASSGRLNRPLSSQKKNTQSSTSLTRSVKNDYNSKKMNSRAKSTAV